MFSTYISVSKSRTHHQAIAGFYERVFLYFAIISLMVFCMPGVSISQQTETCIGCHTSDKTLKMLYKPVRVESAEGEG